MKVMISINEVLEASTESLMTAIRNFPNVRSIGKNFIYLEGDKNSPFCIISHVDTCTRKGVALQCNGTVMKNLKGLLGADDRAGVYAAITIYNNATIKPHLLFTDLEEVGGVGAKEVATLLTKPDGVKLLVELDRQGCNEYVVYQDQQSEVHDYIRKFGFVEQYGSYSDISDIGPAWECASVNLSIGYYHQHTDKEELHLDEMHLTIQRVLSMTEDPIMEAYPPPEQYGFCDRYSPYEWSYGATKKSTKKKSHNLSMVVGSSTRKECGYCGSKSNKLYKYEDSQICGDCLEYLQQLNAREFEELGDEEEMLVCYDCGHALDENNPLDNVYEIDGQVYCGYCASWHPSAYK